MNILYFASVDFYQKPNPSFHLMHSMITDLIENGDVINYVGCAIEGIDNHIPKDLDLNPQFNYKLVSIPNTHKSSFVKRYLDGIKYVFDAKKYIKEMLLKSDIVFIQSSPTVYFNISLVKHLINDDTKIVYNVQDMFPGSSIASGVMPQKWMQKFFYTLQKKAYKKADCITAISDDMKNKLIEQSVPPEKIEVIVNWFDDRTVSEVNWENNRFVTEANMNKDNFYVQYAGTMGYVFNYEMIIRVAELLRNEKQIVFQMIGEGSQKQAFIEAVRKKKLDNIEFLPLQKQEMVADVYSACSVCIIPLKHGVIGNSVPSKVGLVMACKRPIITSTDQGSKYNDMINNNGIGFAYSDDDSQAIANSILKLYEDRELRLRMGEKGYKFGNKLYSRTENMNKYIELFKRIKD